MSLEKGIIMTKHECAVVMAYTGIAMLQGDDLEIFYNYISEKLGKPVWTHELATEEMYHKIREACKDDFLALCANAVKGE